MGGTKGKQKSGFYSFLTSAVVGGGGLGLVSATLQHFCLNERVLLPILEEAGWAQEPVWTGVEKRESLAPPAFEPRTVQHVASRSTHHSIPAPWCQ